MKSSVGPGSIPKPYFAIVRSGYLPACWHGFGSSWPFGVSAQLGGDKNPGHVRKGALCWWGARFKLVGTRKPQRAFWPQRQKPGTGWLLSVVPIKPKVQGADPSFQRNTSHQELTISQPFLLVWAPWGQVTNGQNARDTELCLGKSLFDVSCFFTSIDRDFLFCSPVWSAVGFTSMSPLQPHTH